MAPLLRIPLGGDMRQRSVGVEHWIGSFVAQSCVGYPERAAEAVGEHELPDRRRNADVAARRGDFRYQHAGIQPFGVRDGAQLAPKRVFQADARAISGDCNRTFANRRVRWMPPVVSLSQFSLPPA